ncbi:hypothetical protein J6590_099758 [Homalodisca vitripennis]|nr:hypothetical protein J6590_099758 [Homalodisca vitripennis]
MPYLAVPGTRVADLPSPRYKQTSCRSTSAARLVRRGEEGKTRHIAFTIIARIREACDANRLRGPSSKIMFPRMATSTSDCPL